MRNIGIKELGPLPMRSGVPDVPRGRGSPRARPARSGPPPAGGVRLHRCQVFDCDVALACRDAPLVPFGEIEDRLRLLDRRFSRFRPDSEISRLNTANGTWCDISGEMYALLRHALNVAVASRGLINIAVLPRLLDAGYVESWTVHPPRERPAQAPGVPAAPAAPVPPLTEVLELRRDRARLSPGHAVDVGGLAKGKWADDVLAWLGPDAAASLGGDVACHGPGASGDGWPVALPTGETLLLTDGGVATSGVAKRRWGTDAHHLIDPRTGRPSRSDITRATVIAATGACADWASSAMVVGGTAELAWLGARPDVLDWRVETGEVT
jgi:thiamine biosynthesis lipoprotein